MMSNEEKSIPDNFEPHFRKSPFTEPWEPLYSKVLKDQVKIGVVLHERHCNSRGLVHGAFIAALADNAIGLSCGVVLRGKNREFGSLVTTNLSIDYIGMAEVGDWIMTDTEVVKAGKVLCVANCFVSTSARRIARVNATFQNILMDT